MTICSDAIVEFGTQYDPSSEYFHPGRQDWTTHLPRSHETALIPGMTVQSVPTPGPKGILGSAQPPPESLAHIQVKGIDRKTYKIQYQP